MLRKSFGLVLAFGFILQSNLAVASGSRSRADRTKILCSMAAGFGESTQRYETDLKLVDALAKSTRKLFETFYKIESAQSLKVFTEARPDEQAIHTNDYLRKEQERMQSNLKRQRDILTIKKYSDYLQENIGRYNQFVFEAESSSRSALIIQRAIQMFDLVLMLEKRLQSRMSEEFINENEYYRQHKALYVQYTEVLAKARLVKDRILNNIYDSHANRMRVEGEAISKAELLWALESLNKRGPSEIRAAIESNNFSRTNLIAAFVSAGRSLEIVLKLNGTYKISDFIEVESILSETFIPFPKGLWKKTLADIQIEIIRSLGQSHSFLNEAPNPIDRYKLNIGQVRKFLNQLLVFRTHRMDELVQRDMSEKELDVLYRNILLSLGRNELSKEIFNDQSIKEDLGRMPESLLIEMQNELERVNINF